MLRYHTENGIKQTFPSPAVSLGRFQSIEGEFHADF